MAALSSTLGVCVVAADCAGGSPEPHALARPWCMQASCARATSMTCLWAAAWTRVGAEGGTPRYALSSAPLPFSSSLVTAAAIRIVQAFQHIEKNGVVYVAARRPVSACVSLYSCLAPRLAGALLTGSLVQKRWVCPTVASDPNAGMIESPSPHPPCFSRQQSTLPRRARSTSRQCMRQGTSQLLVLGQMSTSP